MLDHDALDAAVLGDRQAAWRFLRAFARGWSQRALFDGEGHTEAELDAAEARLGLPLPAALREGLMLLGNRKDLTRNQDQLLAPDELYVDEGLGVLVFRVENQSCAYWGIAVDALGQQDPPVLVRLDVTNPVAEDWQPWLDRVSVELVAFVLSEALVADDDLMLWEDGAADEAITGTFRRLPIPEYPAGQERGARWYSDGDILVRDDGDSVLIRARTLEALEEFGG